MIRLFFFFVGILLVTADFRENHGRIVGGHETTIEQHPNQVAILINGTLKCGGAILSERLIITSANCIPRNYETVSVKNVAIRVGSSNYLEGGSIYNAEGWTYCPEFRIDKAGMECDVGFYTVKDPIRFGPVVQPIQLIDRNDSPKHGDMATTAGWGSMSTKKGPDARSTILRELRMPILGKILCRTALRQLASALTDTMLCAGGVYNEMVFWGDYGGPLINDKKQTVGIASWVFVNGQNNYPTIFADVTSSVNRDFIDRVLNGTIKVPAKR